MTNTSRSIFGWSYPPGCSGPPEDDGWYEDMPEKENKMPKGICIGCDAEVDSEWDYCPYCGTDLEQPEDEKDEEAPPEVPITGDGDI